MSNEKSLNYTNNNNYNNLSRDLDDVVDELDKSGFRNSVAANSDASVELGNADMYEKDDNKYFENNNRINMHNNNNMYKEFSFN